MDSGGIPLRVEECVVQDASSRGRVIFVRVKCGRLSRARPKKGNLRGRVEEGGAYSDMNFGRSFPTGGYKTPVKFY